MGTHSYLLLICRITIVDEVDFYECLGERLDRMIVY